MLERRIETVFGWPLHISTSPNKRTLYNFPMQGNGAEMLRLAAQRLCDVGLVPCMLVHDGILLELDNEEQIDQAIDIMRWAGREVCNGFEIGVDIDQKLIGGASLSGQTADRRSRCGRRSWTRSRTSGWFREKACVSDDFDLTRFVTRHGKRIAIGTVPSKVTPKKRRTEAEYIGCRWNG